MNAEQIRTCKQAFAAICSKRGKSQILKEISDTLTGIQTTYFQKKKPRQLCLH
jgi:hypothetical protein